MKESETDGLRFPQNTPGLTINPKKKVFKKGRRETMFGDCPSHNPWRRVWDVLPNTQLCQVLYFLSYHNPEALNEVKFIGCCSLSKIWTMENTLECPLVVRVCFPGCAPWTRGSRRWKPPSLACAILSAKRALHWQIKPFMSIKAHLQCQLLGDIFFDPLSTRSPTQADNCTVWWFQTAATKEKS